MSEPTPKPTPAATERAAYMEYVERKRVERQAVIATTLARDTWPKAIACGIVAGGSISIASWTAIRLVEIAFGIRIFAD